MESMGVLKDELLAAEEKEIGGRQIPYIPQGERLMSTGLVVGGRMGGHMRHAYKYMSIELAGRK